MNEPKTNNSEVRAEQAASKAYQTIKLGLDVHADSIVVVRILDHSAPQPAQRFTPAKFRQCGGPPPLSRALPRSKSLVAMLGEWRSLTWPGCLRSKAL